MTTDTASIKSELEGMTEDLPTPVRSWLVEEGVDATDDEAVWVWALVEDSDVDADARSRLKVMARDVVRRATGGRLWAYVLIRGADESVDRM